MLTRSSVLRQQAESSWSFPPWSPVVGREFHTQFTAQEAEAHSPFLARPRSLYRK